MHGARRAESCSPRTPRLRGGAASVRPPRAGGASRREWLAEDAALAGVAFLRPTLKVLRKRIKRGSFLAVLVALSVIVSISPGQLAAQGHGDHDAGPHDGHGDSIGRVHFPTSCNARAPGHRKSA